MPFPAAMTGPFAVFALFNVNAFSLLPLDCAFRPTFFDRLVVSTVLPFLVAAALVCGEKLGCREEIDGNVLDARTAYRLLLLSFAVLPSCAALTFQYFACSRYDLGDVAYDAPSGRLVREDDDLWVLYADKSVECHGARHRRWGPYAGLMIAVYPLGVPLLYLALLWRERARLNPSADAMRAHAAKKKKAARRSSSRETAKQRRASMVDMAKAKVMTAEAQEKALAFRDTVNALHVAHLKFLFEDYRPECYLFPVFEAFRRVALSSLLALYADGGAKQLFLGLLFALASHRAYAAASPFVDDDDGKLAEVANAQLVLCFFLCLALYVDKEGDGNAVQVGTTARTVVLCLVFFAGLAVFAAYVLVDLVIGRERTEMAVHLAKRRASAITTFSPASFAGAARPHPASFENHTRAPAFDERKDDDDDDDAAAAATPNVHIVFQKSADLNDAADRLVPASSSPDGEARGITGKTLFKMQMVESDSDDDAAAATPPAAAATETALFLAPPHFDSPHGINLAPPPPPDDGPHQGPANFDHFWSTQETAGSSTDGITNVTVTPSSRVRPAC